MHGHSGKYAADGGTGSESAPTSGASSGRQQAPPPVMCPAGTLSAWRAAAGSDPGTPTGGSAAGGSAQGGALGDRKLQLAGVGSSPATINTSSASSSASGQQATAAPGVLLVNCGNELSFVMRAGAAPGATAAGAGGSSGSGSPQPASPGTMLRTPSRLGPHSHSAAGSPTAAAVAAGGNGAASGSDSGLGAADGSCAGGLSPGRGTFANRPASPFSGLSSSFGGQQQQLLPLAHSGSTGSANSQQQQQQQQQQPSLQQPLQPQSPGTSSRLARGSWGSATDPVALQGFGSSRLGGASKQPEEAAAAVAAVRAPPPRPISPFSAVQEEDDHDNHESLSGSPFMGTELSALKVGSSVGVSVGSAELLGPVAPPAAPAEVLVMPPAPMSLFAAAQPGRPASPFAAVSLAEVRGPVVAQQARAVLESSQQQQQQQQQQHYAVPAKVPPRPGPGTDASGADGSSGSKRPSPHSSPRFAAGPPPSGASSLHNRCSRDTAELSDSASGAVGSGTFPMNQLTHSFVISDEALAAARLRAPGGGGPGCSKGGGSSPRGSHALDASQGSITFAPPSSPRP
jgi:hypothetical protein